MKHLKTYESYTLRDEIKDLLSNLEDDGYSVRFSYMGSNTGFITISKNNNLFDLNNIKSEVIRTVDFLNDTYSCAITATIGTLSNKKDISIEELKSDDFHQKRKVRILQINLYPKS